MNPLLSRYFFFFLIWSSTAAMAQVKDDSFAPDRIPVSDSVSSNSADSNSSTDASGDNLYQPVADSFFFTNLQIREVNEKQVSRYKKSPDYAYANDARYWQQEVPSESSFWLNWLFNAVLWRILLAVLAILILFGMYQLAKENNFTLLLRKRHPVNSGRNELMAGDAVDFEEAIGRCQAEGNYQMAIRFLYLRLIGLLSQKGGISFRNSSTNAEITLALGTHPQAAQFRWLATAYEHVFYGGFQLDRETYDSLKMDFERLQKTLIV